ncbi:MAG: sigma-E factor negative regulatory protein [Gammaproteobacteria bacterium]
MNREDLSALVDGEIAEDELPRLLDTLADDGGARRSWSRYHLIGDTLRAGAADQPGQPARAAVVPLPPPRRRLPLRGLAVAASVATLAVVLAIGGGQVTEEEAPLALAQGGNADSSSAAGGVTGTPPGTLDGGLGDSLRTAGTAALAAPATGTVADDQPGALTPLGAHDERLNGYLVNFNEQRSRLGVPGVHPYVRIVGFEAP